MTKSEQISAIIISILTIIVIVISLWAIRIVNVSASNDEATKSANATETVEAATATAEQNATETAEHEETATANFYAMQTAEAATAMHNALQTMEANETATANFRATQTAEAATATAIFDAILATQEVTTATAEYHATLTAATVSPTTNTLITPTPTKAPQIIEHRLNSCGSPPYAEPRPANLVVETLPNGVIVVSWSWYRPLNVQNGEHFTVRIFPLGSTEQSYTWVQQTSLQTRLFSEQFKEGEHNINVAVVYEVSEGWRCITESENIQVYLSPAE